MQVQLRESQEEPVLRLAQAGHQEKENCGEQEEEGEGGRSMVLEGGLGTGLKDEFSYWSHLVTGNITQFIA